MLPTTGWKDVSVFISSTFRDMHAERDWLVRFVFPRLQDELRPYRIRVREIDLRWGVLEGQDVVTVCREVIDKCHPFFVGILGERYGFCPEEDGSSVTEDEIVYGVLRERSNPANSLFFFRDTASTLQAVAAGDGHTYFTETASPEEIAAFGMETAGERAARRKRRLNELKGRIRDRGLPVFEYSAQWDADRGVFVGLKTFGDTVFQELKRAILADPTLKDWIFGAQHTLDEADAESGLMVDFAADRVRYLNSKIPHPSVYDQIEAWAESGRNPVLALVGPPGSGKSTLMAALALQHPEWFSHFVGASSTSANLSMLAGRVASYYSSAEGAAQDASDIRALFERAFSSAKPGSVALIDGLDQIVGGSFETSLAWLSTSEESSLRMVISVAEGDIADNLQRLSPKVRVIRVPPLTQDSQREIAEGVLATYQKRLSETDLSTLLSKRGAVNPLYLTIALEELRTVGDAPSLFSQRIAELPEDLEPLLEAVFDRLELEPIFRDLDDHAVGAGLAHQILGSLAASRAGLTSAELVALLPEGDAAGNVPAFLRLLRPFLMTVEDRVALYHRIVAKVVKERYLSEPTTLKARHQQLAAMFKALPIDSLRRISELPFHLVMAGDVDGLREVLGNVAFVARKAASGLLGDLIADFRRLDTSPSSEVRSIARDIRRVAGTIRRNRQTLVERPEIAPLLLGEFVDATDREELKRLIEEHRESLSTRALLRRLGSPTSSPVLFEISGEAIPFDVAHVYREPDGDLILEAGTLYYSRWSLETGALQYGGLKMADALAVENMKILAYLPGGWKAVTLFDKKEVWVYDFSLRKKERRLGEIDGKELHTRTVSVSKDGQTLSLLDGKGEVVIMRIDGSSDERIPFGVKAIDAQMSLSEDLNRILIRAGSMSAISVTDRAKNDVWVPAISSTSWFTASVKMLPDGDHCLVIRGTRPTSFRPDPCEIGILDVGSPASKFEKFKAYLRILGPNPCYELGRRWSAFEVDGVFGDVNPRTIHLTESGHYAFFGTHDRELVAIDMRKKRATVWPDFHMDVVWGVVTDEASGTGVSFDSSGGIKVWNFDDMLARTEDSRVSPPPRNIEARGIWSSSCGRYAAICLRYDVDESREEPYSLQVFEIPSGRLVWKRRVGSAPRCAVPDRTGKRVLLAEMEYGINLVEESGVTPIQTGMREKILGLAWHEDNEGLILMDDKGSALSMRLDGSERVERPSGTYGFVTNLKALAATRARSIAASFLDSGFSILVQSFDEGGLTWQVDCQITDGITLSPDGKQFFACYSNGTIMHAAVGDPELRAWGTTASFTSFLHISLDGRWLLAGSKVGRIELFDIEARRSISVAHTGETLSGGIVCDDLTLCLATQDGRLVRYQACRADRLDAVPFIGE